MNRPTLLAACAALLLAPAANAEEPAKAAAPASPAAPAASPVAAPAPALADPKVEAAIKAAVDKAKQEIRDEVRAELQGAQSAAEFFGTVSQGPRLEFFELDGYYRTRGDLMDVFHLGRAPDTNGLYLFPRPLINGDQRSTLATANMRLRLEPTLNVSEHVRVRAQVDVLDNYVLGSSTSTVFDGAGSPYPVPFYGSSRVIYQGDPTADRDAIIPKRAWAEVETPVGLASFGRMPSAWGLGIVAHDGGGLNDDYGDTVDRLQFATLPVPTPLGPLTFVPHLDFEAEGVLQVDRTWSGGVGQPFDLESGDDARTYGIKLLRLDTPDELRRALERDQSSTNYGAWYQYKTQRWTFPDWVNEGFGVPPGEPVKRLAYAHVVDLWFRHQTQRFHFEMEVAGVTGNVRNPGNVQDPSAPYAGKQLLLRQAGLVARTSYQVTPNKVTLGAEVGFATGDPAPGFGNRPGQMGPTIPPSTVPSFPVRGAMEGPQYNFTTDDTIENFRFNPAYQPDFIFWSRIVGGVTDGWYVKPSVRWDVASGVVFDAAAIYSGAVFGESTPSASPGKNGSTALGLEFDGKLSYTTDDGFGAWLSYGLFQPLDGLGPGDLSRAHFLQFGLAARF